jgi:hypothetical protein
VQLNTIPGLHDQPSGHTTPRCRADQMLDDTSCPVVRLVQPLRVDATPYRTADVRGTRLDAATRTSRPNLRR